MWREGKNQLYLSQVWFRSFCYVPTSAVICGESQLLQAGLLIYKMGSVMGVLGVPWWHSWFWTQRCYCSGLSHSYGMVGFFVCLFFVCLFVF